MSFNSKWFVTAVVGVLALLGSATAILAFFGDWVHGDEPRVALILLIGVCSSVWGLGVATYSATRLRHRYAWVMAAVSALLLGANLWGFKLF
jgi:hypothetical protein